MSISSNSKLKAALTWPGQTRPAVALCSRPTRLSSSRSARVTFSQRWQPAIAHLTGTCLGISPILQQQLREGRACAQGVQRQLLSWLRRGKIPASGGPGQRLAHRRRPLNAENAVRTTGLLTAGRNRDHKTAVFRPRIQIMDEDALNLGGLGKHWLAKSIHTPSNHRQDPLPRGRQDDDGGGAVPDGRRFGYRLP